MPTRALLRDAEAADDEGTPRRRDLRMPLVAGAGWLGALVGHQLPDRPTRDHIGLSLAAIAVAVLATLAVFRRRHRHGVSAGWLIAVVLTAVALAASAWLRGDGLATSPAARQAELRTAGSMLIEVTSDPRRISGTTSDRVMLRGVLRDVRVGDRHTTWHAPVLVIGDLDWQGARLGSTVEARARLGPSDDPQLAAVVIALQPPSERAPPSFAWRAADKVRASIRSAAAVRDGPEAALVPALVTGDDQDLPPTVEEEFRVSGLTHLTAVSGTNLTLVVGFLLIIGRWVGVRGRGHYVLAVLGIVGFILLARTEPSVVRAAAMGTVGLIGLGSNGRDRGVRALGVAVLALLLWDPWLATSVGFVLSALATAGILLFGPPWIAAMRRWLPVWLAEAIAVPLAAQIACTPVVAALSGQVSLVAVAANLLVAPLVGPATVLGLAGGLLGLIADPLGWPLGWLGGLAGAGIVAVAHTSAGLSLPALDWGTGPVALAALTLLCAALAYAVGPLIARRSTGIACAGLMAIVILVPMPTPGWPPSGWLMAMCDVGQGDGLVLNAGAGEGVVIDAGGDPRAMDRCLDRLDIERVPLVVLTHFHADHVDGLGGVGQGRSVKAVWVTERREPVDRAEFVDRTVRVVARVPAYGETVAVGAVTLQVLGPPPGSVGEGPNNASVVVLAEVGGARILLSGDVEPEAQSALARAWPGLRVDILKVPHHGSRYQDFTWLTSLRARAALISLGADNTYGHPATETLEALRSAGAEVHRTDREGDLIVVRRDGGLRIVGRG